ncbi:metal ABC transporter ATP-binding protein [Jongsikchunia kroppenstedtii]|uniref:metal ABC transporter ATP-binding protein n=1 Tax=Jongsikchunia kroppenstedtii TaxID=1121721 RepID=UPI001FDEB052|nr:ATP-binding cassette domain-containing protein [Jongsikchunia kroppenstedtii]
MTVSRGDRVIWADADLAVLPGQFVAIAGPNGAGKSTLLSAVLGQVRHRGVVEVLGGSPRSAADQIGYLPQRRNFAGGVRIRGVDIVRLGLDGHRWGVPLPLPRRLRSGTADPDRRVADIVAEVGAQDYAHRPIGHCSGGEQQRLLIAQALVRSPRLLLLDEPLDSLDMPSQAAISALLRDICKRHDITVMIVVHDINPVLANLDQIICVSSGKVFSGSPDELLTSERLTAIYGVPISVVDDGRGGKFVVGHEMTPHHQRAL